jgi:hypothetical protein
MNTSSTIGLADEEEIKVQVIKVVKILNQITVEQRSYHQHIYIHKMIQQNERHQRATNLLFIFVVTGRSALNEQKEPRSISVNCYRFQLILHGILQMF